MTSDRQVNRISLAQEVWSALTQAMSETAEIEVTTYIDSRDLDCIEGSTPTSRFHTQIDLFNQTVEHEIDRELIDNPAYRELQRWHIEQVRQRQDSLTKNLASLETMRHIVLDRDDP